MQAIEALLQRRSARILTEPAPDAATLDLILAAATRAPDHGRLRPWRFLIIENEGRNRLGEVLAEHLRRTRPEAAPELLEKERGKALRAPLILVVAAAVSSGGKIPEIEQILSGAAAAQSILLACHALGFNAMWKTGSAAYDDAVKSALGFRTSDAIIGFLYVGSVREPAPAPRSFDRGTLVRRWP